MLSLKLFNGVFYPVTMQPVVFLLVDEDVSCLQHGGASALIYNVFFYIHIFMKCCVLLHPEFCITAVVPETVNPC